MKNKLKKLLQQQKGAALYFSIIVLSVILAIAFGLSTLLLGEIRSARDVGRFVPAIYAADAGIERALYGIRKESIIGFVTDCSSACGPIELDNNARYNVVVLNGGESGCSAEKNKCIRSIGSVSDTNRAFEVSF